MNGSEARRTRLSVYGLIEDNGSILLTQLASSEPSAGSWTLPGGGVDWGEHPVEALERELYEETGLLGIVEGMVAIDSRVFPEDEQTGYAELHAIRLIYRVVASGKPRVVEIGGSTSDAAWFPIDELDALPTVALVRIALDRDAQTGS